MATAQASFFCQAAVLTPASKEKKNNLRENNQGFVKIVTNFI